MRELGDEKAVSILINVMFTLCFCQNSLKFTPEKSEFYHIQFKKKNEGTSLEVQELRLHLLMQRVWVQSLVGELGSHMPGSTATRNKKGNKIVWARDKWPEKPKLFAVWPSTEKKVPIPNFWGKNPSKSTILFLDTVSHVELLL